MLNPWPYSLFDYGVTAVAIIALAFIVWLFVRFLNNHMSGVSTILANLVEVTRGLADEFHRLTAEMREHTRTHDES